MFRTNNFEIQVEIEQLALTNMSENDGNEQ